VFYCCSNTRQSVNVINLLQTLNVGLYKKGAQFMKQNSDSSVGIATRLRAGRSGF
jgi:hypothetical protein